MNDAHPCEITLCGATACENVEHPQRGTMTVCKTHASRIRSLPEWRFIGKEAAQ